jgi:hypothetical protein
MILEFRGMKDFVIYLKDFFFDQDKNSFRTYLFPNDLEIPNFQK